MAKKVLIFFPHPLKKNFGGAYTYLYHLKTAFQSKEVELGFLSDLVSFGGSANNGNRQSVLKKLLKLFVSEKLIYSNRISRYLKAISVIPFRKELEKINYHAYDAIHFHETVDIWRYHYLLEGYKGKIVLTSHSPKPYHLELLEDVFGLSRSQISRHTYKKLEMIDVVAFEKADVIVAPCEEALEAYQSCWPVFQQVMEKKTKTFIPTGIDMPKPSASANDTRINLRIPENGFVVCFNGRHAKVKGYDLMIESATHLLDKFPDLHFLITGKEDDPSMMKHERWIESGWTEKPEDFINTSDLVIVPNRQTYFDLNVLLALASGKPIVLSETGGNKYFRQFNSPAISFFDMDVDNALTEAILKAFTNKEKLAGEENRKIFQQHFTLEKFAEAYKQFYLSL